MGLIPAGAGQTPGQFRRPCVGGAHPRGCGADRGPLATDRQVNGSSPRVRGRRRPHKQACRSTGLIPAGAGQTARPRRAVNWKWAHPRGCGADRRGGCRRIAPAGLIPAGAGQTFVLLLGVALGGGSSPRVRGRRAHHRVYSVRDGLIPAGAGQTDDELFGTLVARAHPRGCGADVDLLVDEGLGVGSSPRVRGRLSPRAWVRGGFGLIPAGAGQTSRTLGARRWSRAHPRGCGADKAHKTLSQPDDGSSPRVRGRRRPPRSAPRP